MSELLIRPLHGADAEALHRLLTDDPPDYRQYFVGLDPRPAALAQILDTAIRDRYWGMFFLERLVGLVMLRGLDSGYASPAFGTYIAQSFSRKRLGRLALAYAEAWCRLTGAHSIMLSVHSENSHARREYERAGFQFTGERTARGHDIMRKMLGD